ncbi:cysteine synthase family protein [Actinomadura sp. KC06]|uniref:cysteine synthase family protein n=1 Tax=Actinomadura sp. KC06 TaxID=2530369 RepID=UPI001A9D58E9|nr:cysteine synthase family protein [Actinomadura sp. KC06]
MKPTRRVRVPQILDVIGGTPVVGLRNLTTPDEARLVVKLENANPAGSLKDRPAWYIVEHAERTGRLRPGGTLIESSSGNFSIALAMIGASRGYRVVAVVDPKITPTNRGLLEAFGAEIIVVDEPDDSGSYHKTRIELANRLHRETPGSFRPDQCFNPLNSQAHYNATARELLAQTRNLAAVVCTVSTGGQLGGIARAVKEHAPDVEVIGVDVQGSTVFGGEPHAYLTPGVGLSWTPSNLPDLSLLDEVYMVTDQDAFQACRTLVRSEGLLAGVSTGAALTVALAKAMRARPKQQVAFLAADRGERYLATAFNDDWLKANGLSATADPEDLRERARHLVPHSTRPAEECANYLPGLAAELGSPTLVLARSEWR